MSETATEQLTGKPLLQKVKELKEEMKNPSRRELARLCGYSSKTRKGEVRINVADFYEELLKAKGLNLDNETSQRRGREATYKVTVQKNGQILIGAAYTKSMGLKPGDEFDVKLGYKHIHLIQRDAAAESES